MIAETVSNNEFNINNRTQKRTTLTAKDLAEEHKQFVANQNATLQAKAMAAAKLDVEAAAAAKLEADGEREEKLKHKASHLSNKITHANPNSRSYRSGVIDLIKEATFNPYVDTRMIRLNEQEIDKLIDIIIFKINLLVEQHPEIENFKMLRDNISELTTRIVDIYMNSNFNLNDKLRTKLSNKEYNTAKQKYNQKKKISILREIRKLIRDNIPFFEKQRALISQYSFFIKIIDACIDKLDSAIPWF